MDLDEEEEEKPKKGRGAAKAAAPKAKAATKKAAPKKKKDESESGEDFGDELAAVDEEEIDVSKQCLCLHCRDEGRECSEITTVTT